MALDLKNLISICGWTVQGDLGGWTTYTSRRHGLVFYAKAPPLTPPTWAQSLIRLNFSNAAAAWSAMTQSAKDDYQRANSLCHSRMTAYNLFLSIALKNGTGLKEAVEQATGITLVDPWG